ncbi:MAG TPA: septal ring lytic transglycosylase RlpA family protein [Sphingobacteriaceae bacterium]
MKLLIFLLSFWLSPAALSEPGKNSVARDGAQSVTGKATYYASYFHGRKTSSGERYSNHKYTAAHRTLPFGTEVTVTNIANGRSVVVRINDRGPFNKHFIIDLSQKAAREIGIFGKGTGKVELSYDLD